MRILITGGAGCLGSSLIEKYLPEGNEILVIDNFATGKREVLPETKGLKVLEGSIADEALVNKAFAEFKPTHVINSAASYKDVTNWSEDTNTNILGAIHVAKASLEHGIEKLINFQTALCYGRPSETPIPVSHPTAPFTSYGISKTAGEKYMLQSGLPVVSLRLANICGPRLSIGPIPTFYKRLKAGQSIFCSDTVRDFLDISDFMSLMDIILASDRTVTGVYNVSTGAGHSIKDVYDEVSEYINIYIPDVPILPVGADDVQSVVLDPSQTEAAFSWKAKIDFKNTIRRQIDWYNKYGVSDIYSHLTVQKGT
jgi:UDP-glucose 4-epimerase